MKKYLEITETVTDEWESPDFIRAEITNKTDIEIAEIKNAMLDILPGKVMEHLCGHEDRGACTYREV